MRGEGGVAGGAAPAVRNSQKVGVVVSGATTDRQTTHFDL